MKATAILAQAEPCQFEAWATMASGVVRRLEFTACSQSQALDVAFGLCPLATAMSVRQASEAPPRDALGVLDRRARQ